MSLLGTWHSTFVSWDEEFHRFCHGVESKKFVNITSDGDNAILSYGGKYIAYNGKKFLLSNEKYIFQMTTNDDATCAFKIGEGFLSARLNQERSIELAPKLLIWEKFTLDGNHKNHLFTHNLIKYIEMRSPRPLMLACCCGYKDYGDGQWFCTDIIDNSKLNIGLLDISKKFPCHDNLFDFIYIEHGLEHVPFEGVINFCQEAFRVLSYSGVLRIASPGLDNWIKYYISNDDFKDKITNFIMSKFFKSACVMGIKSPALVINNMMHNWGHKCVLDFATYKDILLKSGFLQITQERPHHSKYKELNNLESRIDFYSDFETLVLEARK